MSESALSLVLRPVFVLRKNNPIAPVSCRLWWAPVAWRVADYCLEAGQLPPAFGLHALESEGSNEASPQTCSRPILPLAQPARYQSQAPKERRLNSGAIVLIAGVIAVAIAYYFSTAGVTPELASIGTQPVEQSPKPIATPTETKVTAQTSGEENDQGGGKSASQAEASFSRPAVSGTSIESLHLP
jgi:hypothetical protein